MQLQTAGDKTAEAGIPKTPADPNPQTQPTATESEVEVGRTTAPSASDQEDVDEVTNEVHQYLLLFQASGDETETTNPETVVLETEVEGQAVDEAGSGDEEITAAETRVGATGGESVVETDSDKGQEEKEEDFVRGKEYLLLLVLVERDTPPDFRMSAVLSDAQGRQILTEKAELKFSFGGEDQASSYYCESGGTM